MGSLLEIMGRMTLLNNQSENQSSNVTNSIPRRQAVGFFVAFGIVVLFLVFLSIPFINPVMGPLIVVLLTVIVLGVLRLKKPELFSALKRAKYFTGQPSQGPVDPLPHEETHRSYLMLIGLSSSNQYRITVNESPFIIGRDSASNFKVEDRYVSERHMIIQYDVNEKKRMVTDVSSNGTYLNGKRLQKGLPTPLEHGDTLQIGGVVFSVEFVHF